MSKPPQLFLKFLRWFCHQDLLTPIEGDLIELFEERVAGKGLKKAKLIFIIDVLLLFRPSIIKPTEGTLKINNYGMFKNYLKVGIRNILRHKTFSFINIFGLAIAMAVSLSIILLLVDQTSYDTFHPEKERIYRVLSSRDGSGLANASSPLPLAQFAQKNYPIIENATTLLPKIGGDAIYLKNDIRKNSEVRGFFVDEYFFKVFGFELASGDKLNALKKPNSIIITSNISYQLFNNQDPIGKVIQLSDRGLGLMKIDLGSEKEGIPQEFGSYQVTGVINENQFKTHIKFDVLVSNNSLPGLYKKGLLENDSENWNNYSKGYTYLMVQETVNEEELIVALDEITTEKYASTEKLSEFKLIPQALTSITPGQFVGNPISLHLPIQVYYVLIALALIIMFSACLNYTNLSIARITTRAKEIGIRKVNGASRANLIVQFLTESVLTSFFSLIMANVILIAVKPFVNKLWIADILNFNLVVNLGVFAAFIGFSIIVGLIAGIYPSLVVSRYAPLKVLKKLDAMKPNKLGIKMTLNIVQLGFSLFFIVTSLLIGKQFKHFTEFEYGFNADNLVNIPLQGNDYKKLVNEFNSISGIENISTSEFIPALLYRHGASIRLNPSDEWGNAENISVGPNFTNNLGLQLVAGNPLNNGYQNIDHVLVNHHTVEALGFENAHAAIDQDIYVNGRDKPSKIIGVVSDFNFETPIMGASEMPLILYNNPELFSYINIKISPNNYSSVMANLQGSWESIDPYHPFKYYNYNEQLIKANYWIGDLVSIIGFITLLAVIISCFGLLGMAIYTTERRIKEVGIRKILGASSKQLMGLLGKSFVRIFGIAILISAPLSYLINNFWLENIPNRVGFGIGTIILGIIILLTLGLLTISSQIFSASRRNPIDSIKYE